MAETYIIIVLEPKTVYAMPCQSRGLSSHQAFRALQATGYWGVHKESCVMLWNDSRKPHDALQALRALGSSWESAGRLRVQGGASWSWDAASAAQLDAALAKTESQPLPQKVRAC